jgi:5-methylcytosine-specific restriction endonuclease McrA
MDLAPEIQKGSTRRPPATAEEATQALDMRLAGATYKEIARRMRYAHASKAYELVLRAVGDDARLRQAIRGRRARTGVPFRDSDGYMRVYRRGHPLARKSGEIAEHRAVLFAELGDGPHPCAVCGRVLDWEQIEVDHIDGDRANNRLENLQAACKRCNLSLGRQRWRRRMFRLIHGWDLERAA